MVLIEIGMKSTDPRDISLIIFCDLTYNHLTTEYRLEYVGPSDHIRSEIKKQSARLIDELKSCGEYESIFNDLEGINMNKPIQDEVRILLTHGEACRFHELLCELPFRAATSYDNEPPTEREKPIESVIKQLHTQVHWDQVHWDDE